MKPGLGIDVLLRAGFVQSSRWALDVSGGIVLTAAAPASAGVYVKAIGEVAMYVGVAHAGLALRMRSYAKPGPTQRTSHRINGLVKARMAAGDRVDLYFAFPKDLTWNDLPVCGVAGLEQGLIHAFDLPWNIRGRGSLRGLAAASVPNRRVAMPSSTMSSSLSAAGQTEYYVYENWTVKRVRVHRGECGYCNFGRGMQAADSGRNGRWHGPYADRATALASANSLGQRDTRACASCGA